MSRIFRAGALAIAISGCLATETGAPGRDPGESPSGGPNAPPSNDPSAPLDPNNPHDPSDPTRPGDPTDPSDPTCESSPPPVVPRVRRLTFAQYDRTVSDLVGFAVTPSAGFGPEIEGVTGVLWDGIQNAAAAIARQANDNGALASLIPCQPSGDGSACARQFVETFGRRAYRRPLTEQEIERYLALYADRAELTEGGTFIDGVEVMLEAFLQSPSLLLRVESSFEVDGGRIALSGYELATRLSYTLWNGPPDEALLDAAESGALATPEGLRTEALRMLSTEEGIARARPLIRSAHRDWLGMEGEYGQFWSNTTRDPELFPEFYDGIDADFREEVLRFVDHVVFEENGRFSDLFTSPVTVVNGPVSRIYGLDGSIGSEWTPVALDPAERPGLLTRAGFVGTHGRFSRGSLIYRGAFVLRRLLCLELGSPPAGAESTPLPEASETLRTTRDRIQAMTANPVCAGCHHQLINPAGFGLEYFDGIGRYRTEENGAPIDPTGTVFLDGNPVPYDGPASLGALLGNAQAARACYVSRFAEFTFGEADVELGCAKNLLARRLGEEGVTIKDFLADFVASDAFRFRSVEEAE